MPDTHAEAARPPTPPAHRSTGPTAHRSTSPAPGPAAAPDAPARPVLAPLPAAALVAGGALFFLGGALHPHEDPPGLTLEEHLRVMFEDPAWYPAHAVLLAGMALMAVALVALARGRALAPAPRAQAAATVAAVAAVAATAGSALHLVAAVESDRIATGRSTPLVDANGIVETLTAPAFGLAVAALAVIAATARVPGHRPLGNRVVAVVAVVGGVGYALAAATFLFTDAARRPVPPRRGHRRVGRGRRRRPARRRPGCHAAFMRAEGGSAWAGSMTSRPGGIRRRASARASRPPLSSANTGHVRSNRVGDTPV